MFHTRPVPSLPAQAHHTTGSSFVWDTKFVIPIHQLSEASRLVCTIWHVDTIDNGAAGITSQVPL